MNLDESIPILKEVWKAVCLALQRNIGKWTGRMI